MNEDASMPIDLVQLVVVLQDNPIGGLILVVLVSLIVVGVVSVKADKTSSKTDQLRRRR